MKDRWQLGRDALLAIDVMSAKRGVPVEEIIAVLVDPRVESAIVNAAIEARV